MDEPAGATDLESNMETNSSRATITPAQIMALFIQGLPCGSLSSFIFTLFTVDPKIGVHGQITIFVQPFGRARSEEHTSELQSLMRISYAVFCLKQKNSRTEFFSTAYLK